MSYLSCLLFEKYQFKRNKLCSGHVRCTSMIVAEHIFLRIFRGFRHTAAIKVETADS